LEDLGAELLGFILTLKLKIQTKTTNHHRTRRINREQKRQVGQNN